jgi:hypothetical protein
LLFFLSLPSFEFYSQVCGILWRVFALEMGRFGRRCPDLFRTRNRRRHGRGAGDKSVCCQALSTPLFLLCGDGLLKHLFGRIGYLAGLSLFQQSLPLFL